MSRTHKLAFCCINPFQGYCCYTILFEAFFIVVVVVVVVFFFLSQLVH